ncbi:LarC family nickel insertion protein [Paenibacillus thermoaerophilus]|uniref:LarC family nickel insertion protein n=1 Tax=Paenibacillus thermoaerophilus TaxID=1215385 RepID=A0ABW2V515_9BACL|nr:LarC family nickel insertion protein [Paenibacillus thermoaerophilus]TMV18517.1 LarC family nickel insertion protein [Paenibacillus thermoaerophilus]
MRIVYLDCFSGLSGDMTLAALVDAGADREYVERELAKIAVEPFKLEWKRVLKKGVSALKLDVVTDPSRPPTHHRPYSEIVRLIDEAGFSPRAARLANAIFEEIGVAEGRIHGVPLEHVHFHEVGAIDSIADVCGVALALDSLDVDAVWCAPVPLGSGTVRCDHGLYPVPAPATLEMMRGRPVAASRHSMELTTPTGAGIAAGVVDKFHVGLPDMTVESIGYGAGTRDLPDQPNVLRAVVGTLSPQRAQREGGLRVAGHGHDHPHPHDHSHVHDHSHAHGHDHTHPHK